MADQHVLQRDYLYLVSWMVKLTGTPTNLENQQVCAELKKISQAFVCR